MTTLQKITAALTRQGIDRLGDILFFFAVMLGGTVVGISWALLLLRGAQ
jgi:uncharacterized membrane protein YjjP (DUF1212 family)